MKASADERDEPEYENLSVFLSLGRAMKVLLVSQEVIGAVLYTSLNSFTHSALCSGMLVLEATTAKIKRGYFLPLHRPEISTLSWQQSGAQGVCTWE